jgi:heat shock protein HtpX
LQEASHVHRGRNYLKTTLLLAGLSGLLVLAGRAFGPTGMTIALGLAALMNLGAYFFSDKLALAGSGARPVTEAEAPGLYRIVRRLADRAQIPMPRLYVSPSPQPNAFATGRDPRHAAVAVTQGILPILDERELEGVLAHELSHVGNRDILISSVAATIGAAITYLAQFALFFGGGSDDDDANPFVMLLMFLLAPIAAMIIQMAVSRSRELGADASGARITGDPLALASAVRKIDAYGRGTLPATTNPSTAHLFISNPFKQGGGIAGLFSTHPRTDERVARLQAMASDPSTAR